MQTGNPLESQKNTTVEAVPSDEEFFCKWVLYYEVGLSRVRIWDLAIFVPNFIFFLFMLVQFNRARLKLRATSSPIFATFFSLVYAIITLLPWSRLRERLALPTKKNFYYYVGMLSVLNGIQCVGSGLLLYRVTECGLCIVDVTTLLYYTFLTPFVYYTFLADFSAAIRLIVFLCHSVAQPVLLFSYKSQIDDSGEEESVSLPHQHSFSSLKADSDYIYQANGFYDSTQLDTSSTPIHPLYAVSLRSPDSVTGYSISSVNADQSVAFHQ
ncbi:hypothetical protein OUZ56_029749 [Daphnia magna]|uniref:Uncharacterized protein n=1 Tax=Daphnia magna TaxID=35525 RepID=A0ABR0B7Q4_9CRUS|nr:hypothetical protein OUZ56_029749 [Daphnia magna]